MDEPALPVLGHDDVEPNDQAPPTAAAEPPSPRVNRFSPNRFDYRRSANPARISLADELGHTLDGAWWPRTSRIANELPTFIRALDGRIGEIVDLGVNWPRYQRPPDLNWNDWKHADQHVVVAKSRRARVTMLVIPYTTNQTLAQMILCCASRRPVSAAQRATAFFENAEAILHDAEEQIRQHTWSGSGVDDTPQIQSRD